SMYEPHPRKRLQSLVPGLLLGKRFRTQRKIAMGAMGELWLGEHAQLQLPVAIKVLRREAFASEEIVTRFSREAFLLGQIHSDHVARVLDFMPDTPHGPILVMEFVEGPSLAQLLETKQLSIEEAVELGI